MANIFLLSGLGADENFFRRLDVGENEVTIIRWISNNPGESLQSYCKRLIEPYPLDNTSVLIGVSFGGICAVEIAKMIKLKKVIILSTVKTKYELDWKYKIIKKLKLYRIITRKLLLKAGIGYVFYIMGARDKDDLVLLANYVKTADQNFLRFGVKQIAHWQNEYVPPEVVHIHGTNDHIFFFKKIKGCIPVIKGRHLMLFNKSSEVSKLILNNLD